MRVPLLSCCLALSLSASAAMSQPVAGPCDQFGGYELQNCLSGELTKADRALNKAYQKTLAFIAGDPDTPAGEKPAWKQNLVAAQRAWLAFRDANCKFELIGAEWHNGSGTTAAQQQCVLTLTQQRTEELLSRLPDDN